MRAALLTENEKILYSEIETPSISDGEVLVQVKAAGICGSDVPRVLKGTAHHYPIVLGHEFSGVVADISRADSEKSGLAIGDSVTAAPLVPCMICDDCVLGNYSLCKHYSFIGSRVNGAFAEYVKVPVKNAVKFDKSISFEQGSFFEPSTVALHGLMRVDFTGGGDMCILGGGTIGIFTLQWAKIFGAKRVVVFDIEKSRLDLCEKFGADAIVNSIESDPMQFTKEYTNGKGFDYIFETAGSAVTMKQSFALAGNKARICFIGTPTVNLDFTPAEFENMNRKEFMLTGSWMSYSAPFPGKEWTLTAHYFKTGQLKFDESLIYKKFALKDADTAFGLYKENKVKGKILLIP